VTAFLCGSVSAVSGEEYEPATPIDRNRTRALSGDHATALVGLDTRGAVRTWNRPATALTGFEPTDVIGDDLDELVAADVDSEWSQRAIEQAADGDQFVDEIRLERKDAEPFRAAITVAVARDADGNPSGYHCSIEAVGDEETTNRSSVRSQQWLQALFDKSPDAIAVHDESGRILAVNEQNVDDLGYSRETLRSMNVADFDVGHDRAELQELWNGMATGDRVKTSSVHRRKDGTTFPVEVWVTKLGIGDELQFLALGRDVSERDRAQRRLAAERDVFDAGPVVLFERSAAAGWPIEYVSSNVGEILEYTPEELVGARDYADLVHPRDLPAVESAFESLPGDAEDQFDIEPYRVLTATDEVRWVRETTTVLHETDGSVRYLGYLIDVTDQKERERTLERQRTSLKRIQQITESLRPLNRELIRASTPEEIQSVVCDQLARTDSYEFVWYGEYDPLAERIIPRVSTGNDDGFLESIEITVGEGETALGPAGRTVRTKEVHASRSIVSDPSFEPWREEALARGFRSGAAIPVVVEGNVHGVVGVYSDRPRAFDEYEQGLLEELGERIGHALQAAEQRRLLYADSVAELVFRTADDRSPFVAASEQCDCRLELEGIIPAVGSTYVSYLTVTGADPADVVSFFETADGIEEPRVISSDGPSGTIEYRVCTSPVTKLLEYDATVSSAVIEDGVETVHGEVAPEVPTQPIVAGMQSAYADLELVAKRTVDRPFRSTEGVSAVVDDVLTDRQREVLSLAYHAGFFESPRRSTGDDLADVLGIAAPTFYLHVRRGTKNVLGKLAEFDVLE
jgi:PAS domain S-box-containing protein